MRRDSSCLFPGAAREQLQNGLRHPCHKVAVLFPTAHIVPPAPCRALLSIGLAFFFCALKRRYLDQDTLAFVTATGPAKANNDRGPLVIFRIFVPFQNGSLEEIRRTSELRASASAWPGDRGD